MLRLPNSATGWQRITSVAKELKFQDKLTDTQSRCVTYAVQVLKSKKSSERLRKYQRFLDSVLQIKTEYFLLSAIAFSQNLVYRTQATILEELLSTIEANKENTAFIRPDIRSFATKSNVPGAAQLEGGTLPLFHEGALNHIQSEVFANASLDGVRKVLGECTCDAIRRTTVGSDLKAAVTMTFPIWGMPVQCLMSLDVCEQDVERLAKTLFNAKVQWVDRVLHVLMAGAFTFTIPNNPPEIALKGVRDEAIIQMFGPEIHSAIAEGPIREKELMEGKHITECVSMILFKNGGIINIVLGLEGGLQIQRKLYA